jgi:hypothetical protein
MIYHFVVGDHAAGPLRDAIATEPSMEGEVIVLKDILHIGPLQKEEGQSFSEMRTQYWQQVVPQDKDLKVDDMERLLEVSAAMFRDETAQAWFWMAPAPADVCAFHWLLNYLGKHMGRFYLLNIANLPFLDENGKVFYPKSIAQVLPREIVKARRLARPVTPAELEIDGDEWRKLTEENAGIRTHGGGKKLASQPETYYDDQLLSFCSHQYQKASRIVSQALNKFGIPTGDVHLGWRLREMAASGRLQLQGNVLKELKDFEVKLPGGDVPAVATTATEEQAS